jgi:LacI family transcriptional regulator, gluconate utilization system Gnt-I transcriptional repressor
VPSKRTSAKPRSGAARMREVAELAGVSRMTVSRALNNPTKVKEDLRVRVLEAVRTLGYVHNHLARNLSSQRSDIIGLVLPSLENSIFAQTVKGISDSLRPRGLQLMLAEAEDNPEDEERVINSFLAHRVGGLILHSGRHSPATLRMLKTTGTPIVETGDLPHKPVDMVVSYSNYEAAKAMTHHLARLGYRAIALARLANNPRAAERQRGYLDALRELGISTSPNRIIEVSRGIGGGSDAVSYLEERLPDTDALFCAGDVLAIGALLECNRRGWSVPQRLAIASFDDVEIMRHVAPAMTCLRLPRYEIGRRSAEMLLARMAGVEPASKHLNLGFEIMQRASA